LRPLIKILRADLIETMFLYSLTIVSCDKNPRQELESKNYILIFTPRLLFPHGHIHFIGIKIIAEKLEFTFSFKYPFYLYV